MTDKRNFNFSIRTEWPLLLLIFASLAYGAYVYPTLPDQVPSHWNYKGEVDGWSSPLWGAFGIPLLNVALYIMFFVIPKIDPKKEKYASFSTAYNAFRYVFHLIMLGLFVIVISAAQGLEFNIDRLVPMAISLMFIVIGNYMGKIQKNYFFGIRTPWTLDSEEVWRKTHRISAPIWVGAGFIGFIGSFFGGAVSFIAFFTAIFGATIFSVVYSYFAFKTIEKAK